MTISIFMQAAPGGGFNSMWIILLAMFAVMYFFMIRPQQKKQSQQKKFITDLKKGDRVVTMGGIHGRIVSVSADSDTILLEVSEGTKIKFDKSVISMEYTKASYKEDEKT